MLVIVTRDVEPRYRGFIGSIMLEIAPGVYAHSHISAGVRSRIWEVIEAWYAQLQRGSIIMTWSDANKDSGMGLATLGQPPKELVSHDAVLLVRRDLPAKKDNENHAGK